MPASPRRHAGPGHDRSRVTNAGRRIARKAVARAHVERKPRQAPRATDPPGPDRSPRFEAARAGVDHEMERLFPDVERVVAYGMHGWRVQRPRQVEWTHGTVDPNFVQVFLAERSQGISLHLWNPYDPRLLARRKDELAKAGFKVMVGCIQFNRKADYPVDAVVDLLEPIAEAMAQERRAPKGRSAPSA